MVGRMVAYCDGKRAQTSRIEKMLEKNRAVYRPELARKEERKHGKKSRRLAVG